MQTKTNTKGSQMQNRMLEALLTWYHREKRPLPWRMRGKDHPHPVYRVWISEIMLQQTQVSTVWPYYKKFLKGFPNLESLATSPLEEVLSHWSGLGYYRRAKQLHATAQILHKRGGAWPKTYKEWIQLPGIGPYTARAISSIAFNEKVGALDGNIIRVLCRFFSLKIKWWETKGREKLQKKADELCQTSAWLSGDVNQALMELGARICQATQAACPSCPLNGKGCKSASKASSAARASKASKSSRASKASMASSTSNSSSRLRLHHQATTEATAPTQAPLYELPLKRPKKDKEKWLWKVSASPFWKNKNKIGLLQNKQSPFLKKTWLPPGQFCKVEKKPEDFQFQHHITHHQIFVQLEKVHKLSKEDKKALLWVDKKKISQINPSSLVKKVLTFSAFSLFCFVFSFSPSIKAKTWKQAKWGFAIEEKGFIWKRQAQKQIQTLGIKKTPQPLALYQSLNQTGQLSLHLDNLHPQEKELKQYIKRWIKDYELYGFQIQGKGFFRLQKRPAFVLDLFHPKTQQKLRQVTVLVNGLKALVFTCQSPKKLFQTHLSHCNQILQSVYWL